MKNNKYILLFVLIVLKSYSQDFTSNQVNNPNILPPEVSSFQKVNFLPVSNYTGRANIEIPFYSIDLGGLQIPIALTYNTGGVKPNDVASSTGLNWSLNAGGMISKVIKGMDDFTLEWNRYYDYESHTEKYLGPQGWLYGKLNDPFGAELQTINDQLPDIFNVSAPNLNISYIHNETLNSYYDGNGYGVNQNGETIVHTSNLSKNGEPFILDSDKSYIINETYGNAIIGMWGKNDSTGYSGKYSKYWYDNGFNPNYTIFCINSIKIYSINGYEYLFDKIDSSQYLFDRDITHTEAEANFTPLSNINVVSYRLSKITDLKTNKFVEFQYESYSQSFSEIIDNNSILVNTTAILGANPNQKGLWNRNPKLNRLKKIIFENGYVNFNYNLNREDVPGEKALTEIVLFDSKNNQIKKAILNFEYFQSDIEPNSPFSKRLKLKDVSIQGSTIDLTEKYKLTYNPIQLPLRIMAVTDYFGYNNGEANKFQYTLVNNQYVLKPPLLEAIPHPKLFFNPNKGQYSFFPEALNANAVMINGNYSLSSNLTYCKAASLERIDYPTGGYSTFEYELNRFLITNVEIEGGGLRVKEQKISEGINSRTLKFDYKTTNNTTSGAIVNMPKFIDFIYSGPFQSSIPNNLTTTQFNSWFQLLKFNYAKSNIELTNGAYIGYSRVKVFEENNGYTVYNYTSPNTFPNTSADVAFTDIPFPYNTSNVNNYKKIYYDHGKVDLFFDTDVFRGRLTNQSAFNQQNQILKETINQYTVKDFNSLVVSNNFSINITAEEQCQLDLDPRAIEPVCLSHQYGTYKQRRYLLTNVIEKEYFNGQLITKNKDIEYDYNYSLVKKENITDNLNSYRNEYYYPYDVINQSEFGMSNLNQSNRKSERILSYSFKNNEKVLEEKTFYNNFNGLILPKQIKKFKSGSINNSNEINSLEITLRDNLGNICEVTDKTGNKTSFIWGYNQTSIIAKIENASYVSIPTSIIASAQSYSNTGTELQLKGMLDVLRSTMTNAFISTYTYKPLVGITTITDPKGDILTYEYDTMGRLKTVRDKDNNIISENNYHYKPQN